MRTAFALLSVALSLPAVAKEKSLAVVFTGDNWGEIEPCG